MKAYWGSGGIIPRIPDLGINGVSGQLHDPADLPPGKEPLVSIGEESGRVSAPFWTQW